MQRGKNGDNQDKLVNNFSRFDRFVLYEQRIDTTKINGATLQWSG